MSTFKKAVFHLEEWAMLEQFGVKLRGNETFDELLKLERDQKERQERLAEDNANIERVDAQTRGVKKW